jgi:hypothetical protein
MTSRNGQPSLISPAAHSARGEAMMQTWEEHIENHEHFTRDWLDQLALRHVEASGGSLSAATLSTLTASDIDYLYARIAMLLEKQ